MTEVLQLNMQGDLVHNHYVETGVTDVTDIGCDYIHEGDLDENLNFYIIASNNASVFQVRGPGQFTVTSQTDSSSGLFAGRGIEVVGNDTLLLSLVRTSPLTYICGLSKIGMPPETGALSNSYVLSNAAGYGACTDGMNFYHGLWFYISGYVNRVIMNRPTGDTLGSYNSSPGWSASATQSLRGVAYDGMNFWVLFRDGTSYYLEHHRNTGSKGIQQNWIRISQTDIASYGNQTPKWGLTFDGQFLYTMTNFKTS
jgi:hypothetical protein